MSVPEVRLETRYPTNRCRLSALFLFSLMAMSSVAFAQAPAFFEPKEHYYKAQGVGVTAVWSVSSKTVPEDGELTATLTVAGELIHPEQIVRPNLQSLPEFAERFLLVENVAGQPVAANAKSVSFIYRLRPRNRSVDQLPTLEFFYLNPHAPEDRRFMKTRAKKVEITVTAASPKPVQPAPAIPLVARDELFQLATGPALLSGPSFVPGVGSWLALLIGGVACAFGWYVLWQRLYPDAARQARLRRHRAVRYALNGIRRAGKESDSAAAIAAAVLNYLRERFSLPEGAETSGEIGDALRSAGLTSAEAERAAAFFRRGDAARFAPSTHSDPHMGDEAIGIVAAMEERV
jgi:hypothetical protein